MLVISMILMAVACKSFRVQLLLDCGQRCKELAVGVLRQDTEYPQEIVVGLGLLECSWVVGLHDRARVVSWKAKRQMARHGKKG